MKTCVSSYSFGGYMSEGSLGVLGIIDKAAEFGFDAIEFVDKAVLFEGDMPERIKERAAEKGIAVPAFCTGADFLNGSNGDLKDEIKAVCRAIDNAAKLGVKVVRHDATRGYDNNVKRSRSYDDALPRIAEGCREVSKYAEQLGIKTCTENHGFFSQDANRVEKLINTVAYDNFGALVDCGNFMCADEDPTVSVGIMAPYAFHVHVKDFHYKSGMDVNPGAGWFQTRAGNYIRGAIIGHGEAKLAQSIRVLKKYGYDGYVSIEFEGMEDRLTGISVGFDNLKRFIEMA